MATQYPVEFGDYRLLKKIAQGGMAEIFLAQDPKGEICALKRILSHLAHEEGFIRMFIDEARIVSNLDHTNVARVYGQGKHDGFYYIAMEYVEGQSLLALSDRARSQKMTLPRGLLAYIVAELLGGLAYAHNARDAKGRHLQIVHRDVTPQNVMIGYDGGVKLIDFGVAKARARLTQTEAGFTKGKLSYMSPEQARGEELDARSDLFSVGIILYEITTNTRLFNKEGPGGILSAIVNDPIAPPSHKDKTYPRELEAIVMRALEKDVDRRWQSGEEMRDALLRFAAKEKPKPGKKRLEDLVHDLFGEPEHRKVIEEAQAVVEPTPASVEAHAGVRGASLRIKGATIPPIAGDTEQQERKPDETRMMDLLKEKEKSVKSSALASAVMVRPEITKDSVKAVALPIEHDPSMIPEPEVPFRVKVGKQLAELSKKLRSSWQRDRKKWALGIAAGLFVMIFGGAWAGGFFRGFADMVVGARDKAKAIKRSAGLVAENVDAGVRPTVLHLVTEPPGAAITVDGLGAGCVTPCDLKDQELGKRLTIEVALGGYRKRTEKLTLRANEGTKELVLALERIRTAVTIESEPPGASVWANGAKLNGETPLTYDGVRTDVPLKIEVKKSGYISRSKVIIPKEGEETRELFTLDFNEAAVPPGKIDVITSPPGCSIKIDGNFVGSSPVMGFEAKRGVHTVEAACENYETETQPANVQPKETTAVRISPEANVFGYLTLELIPPDGNRVTINGREVNLGADIIKVIPGRHVVEVENRGLNKQKSVSIDVRPNQRLSRTINLLR